MDDQNLILLAWKARLATVWVTLVFLAYLGTILMERGERIGRILRVLLG